MQPKIIPPHYLLVSAILIAVNFFLTPEYNLIPFPFNFAGLIPVFAGLALMGKCRDTLKKHETTHMFDDSTSLVCEGIFRRTRNPMYLGMIILLTGWAICFCNVVSFVVPLLFYAAIRLSIIPWEERKLELTFGDDYLEYKKLVRRWL